MQSKIYYNLDETEYIFKTENLTFSFSSIFYMEKFKEKYIENRDDLTYKLSSRYNIEFDANDYFDIILYTSIEKRGFKVKDNNEVIYKCQSHIKLNGEIATSQSYKKL